MQEVVTHQKPDDDGAYTWLSASKSEALAPVQVDRILRDLANEPDWRHEAIDDQNFYDGKQLSIETLARMAEAGIPPLIINLIKPTINAVLGMEAISRTDPVVEPENDASFQGAQALNQLLKTATRLTDFNDASAKAFADQIKCGVGWMGIYRNDDPYGYRYIAERVHWQEMWWDYRARHDDLRDARFIVRKKWYDSDEIAHYFPEHARLIDYTAMGWQNVQGLEAWEANSAYSDLARNLETEQTSGLEETEWRDSGRHRVALYEVWYKAFRKATVLRSPDGYVVEFDPANRMHKALIANNLVEVAVGPTYTLRQAYYVGPHRLVDRAWPGKRNFPYVPFFAYREDSTLSPLGVIRDMRCPQMEINARRSRIHHDQTSNRVIMDSDAVDDINHVREEWNRPDALIVLNSARMNQTADAFRSVTNSDTNPVQFSLLEESKRNIHETTGIWPELQGQGAGSAQSGAAIGQLIQQGQQIMSHIMQNYRMSRRNAAILLTHMIQEDLADKMEPVEVDATMERPRRTIFLNAPKPDGKMDNRVALLRTKVVLAERPTSTSYRQQQFGYLVELVKVLPPELLILFADHMVMSSDIANRDELAERIRQHTGYGPTPTDPEAREEAERSKNEQAQAEQREQEADLNLKEAKAILTAAQGALAQARAEKTGGVDIGLVMAQIEELQAKVDSMENDMDNANRESDRKSAETEGKLVETATRMLGQDANDRRSATSTTG